MELILGTAALARRLEEADARNAAESAQISTEVGGGVAAFAGAGSPLTHAIGLGMNGPVSASDLDAVERFYFSRNSDVNIDLCPIADPSLAELLGARAYRIVEFNNILVRTIAARPEPLDARVERVTGDSAEDWSRMLALGFFEHEPSSAELDIGRILFGTPEVEAYCIHVEGVMAAGGAMMVRSRLATLFADATLKAFRGRGLQAALIAARVGRALELGAELATAATVPCTTSQRNYERCGFHVAYTKLNMQRDRAATHGTIE